MSDGDMANHWPATDVDTDRGTCNHKYTHTTIKIAVRDDGHGPRQTLDILVYCLLCLRTTATNTAGISTDWLSAVRRALPDLDRLMADFGLPASTKLDA